MISVRHILDDLFQLNQQQQVNCAFAHTGGWPNFATICTNLLSDLQGDQSSQPPQNWHGLSGHGRGLSASEARLPESGKTDICAALSRLLLTANNCFSPRPCMGRMCDSLALPVPILVFKLGAQSSTPVRLMFAFLPTALCV